MIEIPYNRNKAVEYAKKWALGRNPQYFNYEGIGGDCTNFISQCVYAGTGVMNYTPDFGWYYINPNDKSPSWTGVNYFYNFIVGNEGVGPYGKKDALKNLMLGDVIQFGSEDGIFYHTVIITKIESSYRGKRYYVSSHTYDELNKNLFSYNFYNIRGIHILGARKEQ